MTAPAAAARHSIVTRPLWVVVLAAATAAAIAMGLRQVMGLYLRPVTDDLGIGREAFGLAIAIANIVWGSRRRSPVRSRTSTAPAASWSSAP
jgi:hypothetical protein